MGQYLSEWPIKPTACSRKCYDGVKVYDSIMHLDACGRMKKFNFKIGALPKKCKNPFSMPPPFQTKIAKRMLDSKAA